MKTILIILIILIAASIVSAAFYYPVEKNSSLANGAGFEGRRPPGGEGFEGRGEEGFEGREARGGGLNLFGLIGVLGTLIQVSVVTVLILFLQKGIRALTTKKPTSA